MLQAAAAGSASNTELTQLPSGRASRSPAGSRKTGRSPKGPRVTGDERESVRQADRPVIEMEHGITVYPPEADGEPWRAVFVENGARRFRQGATEAKLAEKLEKVRERLAVEASNMERPGADLIAYYLGPDRLPVGERWSRKHAHTQGRLCALYVAPVIGAVTCQGITTGHMQKVVNAAPTAGEGDRVKRMISAFVTAGVDGGYLVNSRLAKVHWQAGDRPLPAPSVSVGTRLDRPGGSNPGRPRVLRPCRDQKPDRQLGSQPVQRARRAQVEGSRCDHRAGHDRQGRALDSGQELERDLDYDPEPSLNGIEPGQSCRVLPGE